MRSLRVAVLAGTVAVSLGGGGIAEAGMSAADRHPAAAFVLRPVSSATSMSRVLSASPVSAALPAGPAVAQIAALDRAAQVKALNTALKKLAGKTPDFSVGVFDRRTGQRYVYRGSVAFDTASIVKTQILACMLLKAQDAGRGPTAAEMKLARPMIRLSDNTATTTLYRRIGGKSAVTKCNKRLGLTQTVVNSRWGLTRTTASDQIRLLEELVDTKGPLKAASRKTAFTLMNTVSTAQDWGVPAIVRKGEIFTVKNGWDTRTADGGLWAVNSIGRVTTKNGKVDVSVAVLSHNNKSMKAGITLVEKIAELTRQHLRY